MPEFELEKPPNWWVEYNFVSDLSRPLNFYLLFGINYRAIRGQSTNATAQEYVNFFASSSAVVRLFVPRLRTPAPANFRSYRAIRCDAGPPETHLHKIGGGWWWCDSDRDSVLALLAQQCPVSVSGLVW